MKRNGRLAAAQMRVWSLVGKRGVAGWCLKTCRQAWDLPSDDASAIAEWNSIPDERKHPGDRNPPIGAPCFWAVGEFGHVALAASKPGHVWSTDAPTKDRIGIVPIVWFKLHWRAEYLGWAEEFQGAKLPLEPRRSKA